jgi:hypothetical protein
MKYNYGTNIFHTHDRTFTPDPLLVHPSVPRWNVTFHRDPIC